MLGHGAGEGQGKEQGEGQGVVGMRMTEMPVCRRMRRWSPNMIICKCGIEVGRKQRGRENVRRMLDLGLPISMLRRCWK